MFSYVPAPVVTAVTPTGGPEAGGTVVSITGRNLEAASAVLFGGAPATSVTVNTGSELTAVAPAHPGAGAVGVTVTTPGGSERDRRSRSVHLRSAGRHRGASGRAGETLEERR